MCVQACDGYVLIIYTSTTILAFVTEHAVYVVASFTVYKKIPCFALDTIKACREQFDDIAVNHRP